MEKTILIRTTRSFPNNKPWITSDLKGLLLNKKKRAFGEEDKELLCVDSLQTSKEEAEGRNRKQAENKLLHVRLVVADEKDHRRQGETGSD